jgi:hypothetical protein
MLTALHCPYPLRKLHGGRQMSRRKSKAAVAIEPPLCRFCGRRAGRIGDGTAWRCDCCDASVTFDPETGRSIGLLKKSADRRKRDAAWMAFNRLLLDRVFRSCISQEKATRAGFAWLAGQLGAERGSIDFRTMDARTEHDLSHISGGALQPRHARLHHELLSPRSTARNS